MTNPYMLIPQHLQNVLPDGTLIVAADTVRANCWLVAEHSLKELIGVSVPKETGQDGEGSFEFFPDDNARFQAFAKRLAIHLTQLAREYKPRCIHLVMPAEVERTVSKHLSSDVSSNVSKKLHLDLMKEHPLAIVERLTQII